MKWEIASVIPPDLIGVESVKQEEEKKLQDLLRNGYEPFCAVECRIFLKRSVNSGKYPPEPLRPLPVEDITRHKVRR